MRVTPKTLMNDLAPDRFLTDYWQKQPLFLPSAIDADLPELGADELAWLATLEDVESRLVFTQRDHGKVTYRVEHGPFSDADLTALPANDWTLLVQDVEKHLPDFRDYFRLVPFIPAWRIDDLMVSVAAPGGSVGPHKDNYDVFLCQGEGSRNWLVSNDRNVPDNASVDSLALLEPFEPTEERVCHSGDLLYVPPGVPHWGVANDLCTTYSIGMRAPSKVELAAAYARIYAQDNAATTDAEDEASSIFYADPDLHVSESLGGQIAIDSVRRLREQQLLDESLSDEAMLTILGSVATDPNAWLDPESASPREIEAALRGRHALQVHGMALVAWCETNQFRLVFVNGSVRQIPPACIGLVREICATRAVMPDTVQALGAIPDGQEFITWLLNQGILDTG
jgi:50S ribosomal protein L16 3-hydroxylase